MASFLQGSPGGLDAPPRWRPGDGVDPAAARAALGLGDPRLLQSADQTLFLQRIF